VYAEATRERIRWSHELIDEGNEIEEILFLARKA